MAFNKHFMNKKIGRPCLKRKISFNPKVNYFKPQGIKMSELEVVELTKEELEAIRLKNIKNLDQRECAEIMHTSSATFQRIISRANQKIAIALTEAKAIKIIN